MSTLLDRLSGMSAIDLLSDWSVKDILKVKEEYHKRIINDHRRQLNELQELSSENGTGNRLRVMPKPSERMAKVYDLWERKGMFLQVKEIVDILYFNASKRERGRLYNNLSVTLSNEKAKGKCNYYKVPGQSSAYWGPTAWFINGRPVDKYKPTPKNVDGEREHITTKDRIELVLRHLRHEDRPMRSRELYVFMTDEKGMSGVTFKTFRSWLSSMGKLKDSGISRYVFENVKQPYHSWYVIDDWLFSGKLEDEYIKKAFLRIEEQYVISKPEVDL